MKLFVFDMDGTILNDKNEIPNKTIESIKKAKSNGFKIAIATGRPYSDIVRDLDVNVKLFNFLIANNGSYIYNVAKSKFKYFGKLNKKFIDIAIDLGEKNKCFLAIHGSKSAKRSILVSSDMEAKEVDLKEFKEFEHELVKKQELKAWGLKQNITQISLRQDKKVIAKIYEDIKEYSDEINAFIANGVYLDMNIKGVSKLSGIEWVASKLNLVLEEVVAFGDSSNDLEMLKHVGLGVCMGNGNKAAKKVADEIIGDNNTNAIAIKMNEILDVECKFL